MTIHEPMTLATDYLLALASFYFSARLRSENKNPRQDAVSLWSLGLWATGAAALLGGTYHGFSHALPGLAPVLLWKAALTFVGMMSLFMLCGALTATFRHPWLLAVVALKYFAFTFSLAWRDAFTIALWDYVPAMVLVVALLGAHRWIVAGALVSFAAAGAQWAGFGLGPGFNHNDLYHAVQIFGVWLLYRGGRLLKDRA